MKNKIASLGKVLNKKTQKQINGGIKNLIELPCKLPELAPPPIGCNWKKTGPCTYKLVCNSIHANEM